MVLLQALPEPPSDYGFLIKLLVSLCTLLLSVIAFLYARGEKRRAAERKEERLRYQKEQELSAQRELKRENERNAERKILEDERKQGALQAELREKQRRDDELRQRREDRQDLAARVKEENNLRIAAREDFSTTIVNRFDRMDGVLNTLGDEIEGKIGTLQGELIAACTRIAGLEKETLKNRGG